MLDSRFWDGAEWVCKTVRDTYLSVAREFRVAWVSGVEAAQRDAAEALADLEAETEVSEGTGFPSGMEDWDCAEDAVYDDDPMYEAASHRAEMDASPMMSGDFDDEPQGDYHLLATTPRCPNAGQMCNCTGACLKAPVASAAVMSGPEEGATPLAPQPSSGALDTITDVLAEHYLESHSDRRIVGCRCGLELGSRRQHWDHQADLIAGALKARTQAEK